MSGGGSGNVGRGNGEINWMKKAVIILVKCTAVALFVIIGYCKCFIIDWNSVDGAHHER